MCAFLVRFPFVWKLRVCLLLGICSCYVLSIGHQHWTLIVPGASFYCYQKVALQKINVTFWFFFFFGFPFHAVEFRGAHNYHQTWYSFQIRNTYIPFYILVEYLLLEFREILVFTPLNILSFVLFVFSCCESFFKLTFSDVESKQRCSFLPALIDYDCCRKWIFLITNVSQFLLLSNFFRPR
jgi:hypothetical protein